ncbi:MAG: hypothetical protein ACSLEL_01360 [Candidatus Malihini olakiniferum]
MNHNNAEHDHNPLPAYSSILYLPISMVNLELNAPPLPYKSLPEMFGIKKSTPSA